MKSRVGLHTKILRAGVIAALEQGEATTPELAQRMGLVFAGGAKNMAHHLRAMAHRGEIKQTGAPIVDGRRSKQWGLA